MVSYWPTTLVTYIIFFVWGFYSLEYKTFRLRDYWGDYNPIQRTRPAIIVSNHVSYFDIFLMLLIPENPSFLSKEGVKNIPIIGFFAKMHQTLFFARENKDERDKIIDLIKQRVQLAEEGKVNPMVIFPEGTTANGRGLMKFKKGPFALEKPLLLYSIFYNSDFLPCLNLMPVPVSLFITFSLFVNKATFFKFDEAIDPYWILKKHGKEPGQEGNWEIIADEVKKLMCFAFDFEQDELSFKEKSEFECKVQGLTYDQYFSRQ